MPLSHAPIALHCVTEAEWPALRDSLPALAARYAAGMNFEPRPGRSLVLPGADGRPALALFGLGDDSGMATNPFLAGRLATDLPAGTYRFATPPANPELVMLAFHLGAYRFDRFKAQKAAQPVLVAPEGVDVARVSMMAEAIAKGRDLINRPANDLTTEGLAAAARTLAEAHGCAFREVVGDALLAEGFPLVHAVGRASAVPPRLVEFRWGTKGPAVTLVGKGVVFDTGGLNLKPDASMLLMKKDMGGAATALTAAEIIMGLGLKVRLRVILAIVENAVAGAAFRPGDIYRARNGITVEIGNTDAEGRLILADALAYADEEATDYLFDFATLTGAARVALGPDLPPFFTDNDELAAAIAAAGKAVHDPAWRLPLWQPYAGMLDSKVADTNNVSSGGFAGAITAALFLKRFVKQAKAYAHFDMYGWVPSAKPGRPEGGEPQLARLVASLWSERF